MEFACDLLMFRMTWRVCVNFFKEHYFLACPRIEILSCCNALDACGPWKLTLFTEVYNADDNISFTPLATSLRDLDLLETYKAIDSVATGRIPSLFCVIMVFYVYVTRVFV